jgi:hypothetical protein
VQFALEQDFLQWARLQGLDPEPCGTNFHGGDYQLLDFDGQAAVVMHMIIPTPVNGGAQADRSVESWYRLRVARGSHPPATQGTYFIIPVPMHKARMGYAIVPTEVVLAYVIGATMPVDPLLRVTHAPDDSVELRITARAGVDAPTADLTRYLNTPPV